MCSFTQNRNDKDNILFHLTATNGTELSCTTSTRVFSAFCLNTFNIQCDYCKKGKQRQQGWLNIEKPHRRSFVLMPDVKSDIWSEEDICM